MWKRICLILIVIVVTAASSAAADARKPAPPPAAPPAAAPKPPLNEEVRTSAQVQAARQFNFEGVNLGMSLEELLQQYPDVQMVAAESNPKVGLKFYRVTDLESADSAEFLVLDDVLIQVTVFYSPKQLKEMGGETIPFRKLVQKFGKQDRNSPGITKKNNVESFAAKWDFPAIERRISFVAMDKKTAVTYADTTRLALIKKRTTDKANLGF